MKDPESGNEPVKNGQLARIADFFNEVGMLKNIPRSGFPFLGNLRENVAEHSLRAAIIGYALARIAGADYRQVVMLCLFHDLHEARTGDFNYVNHRYDTCEARKALEDATTGTGLEGDILGFWDEFEDRGTLESTLANDADQLDLVCNLQLELSRGNTFAREWLDSALKRLQTPVARNVADAILRVDPNHWWYGTMEPGWWVNHGREG